MIQRFRVLRRPIVHRVHRIHDFFSQFLPQQPDSCGVRGLCDAVCISGVNSARLKFSGSMAAYVQGDLYLSQIPDHHVCYIGIDAALCCLSDTKMSIVIGGLEYAKMIPEMGSKGIHYRPVIFEMGAALLRVPKLR